MCGKWIYLVLCMSIILLNTEAFFLLKALKKELFCSKVCHLYCRPKKEHVVDIHHYHSLHLHPHHYHGHYDIIDEPRTTTSKPKTTEPDYEEFLQFLTQYYIFKLNKHYRTEKPSKQTNYYHIPHHEYVKTVDLTTKMPYIYKHVDYDDFNYHYKRETSTESMKESEYSHYIDSEDSSEYIESDSPKKFKRNIQDDYKDDKNEITTKMPIVNINFKQKTTTESIKDSNDSSEYIKSDSLGKAKRDIRDVVYKYVEQNEITTKLSNLNDYTNLNNHYKQEMTSMNENDFAHYVYSEDLSKYIESDSPGKIKRDKRDDHNYVKQNKISTKLPYLNDYIKLDNQYKPEITTESIKESKYSQNSEYTSEYVKSYAPRKVKRDIKHGYFYDYHHKHAHEHAESKKPEELSGICEFCVKKCHYPKPPD